MKISIVGTGKVGSSAAWQIMQKNLGEILLFDLTEGWPQGVALDMNEAASSAGFKFSVTGTNNFADLKGSDIVIVTAGLPRKEGMSRLDLLQQNGKIIEGISAKLREFCRNAVVMVVTNPVDIMTYLCLKMTGFSQKKVMGLSGVLDSSRMNFFIAEQLKVLPSDVKSLVIGGHGDDMLPLPSHTFVKGKPLSRLLPKEKIAQITQRTKKAGAEIISLMKNSSAFYAPGAALAKMAESIAKNKKETMPVSAFLAGKYGLNDICIGVPCVLGKNGIEKIVEINLTNEELQHLKASEKEIKSLIASSGFSF